jgi:hypothetical protein
MAANRHPSRQSRPSATGQLQPFLTSRLIGGLWHLQRLDTGPFNLSVKVECNKVEIDLVSPFVGRLRLALGYWESQ